MKIYQLMIIDKLLPFIILVGITFTNKELSLCAKVNSQCCLDTSGKSRADFVIAHKRAMQFEGLYSIDKNDRGGETFKGISRRFHPNWIGWRIVDSCKFLAKFPHNLSALEQLEELVRSFYKKEFWEKIRGDEILDQEIANQLFDECINVGLKTGIKLMQRTLNVPETGVMDEKTMKTVNHEP